MWKRLFLGTVPANKSYVTGTVPSNKNYVTGTVPANKSYVTGTLKKVPKIFNIAMKPRVVRTPQCKNVVQSSRESTRAASIVKLYIGLLYHFTTGLSWLNIRFFCN